MQFRLRCALEHGAALALVFASVHAAAITGGQVHAGFVGEWVPASATCSSPLRIVIAQNRVTFVRGAERVEYSDLEQCFSCAGQGVEGVSMLSTNAMGDSHFMITLIESRKKTPVLTVDFSNDRNLRGRFPFSDKALKRCS